MTLPGRHSRTIVAIALLLATGCSATATTATVTSTTLSGLEAGLAGSLTVFAAASLTDAFDDVKLTSARRHPGFSLSFNFGGSQMLVAQIVAGAPADVFASADQANMQKLQSRHLVDQPVVLARNKLAIAVAPGNPRHVKGLADLGRSDLKVVLEDAAVPAGTYARQALAKAAVTVKAVSTPLDVKSALLTVTSGEADAVIVYATDVTASAGKAQMVAIPEGQNVVASYPVAVLRASRKVAAARAFVQFMVSGDGQQALRARGFLPP